MKKARFNFSGWLSKVFFLATLLLFFHGQVHATGSIVNSTKNIVTDNLNQVKNSATAVIEELQAMSDDLTKAANNVSEIWKGGGDAATQSIDKLKESFKNIKKMDVDGLKKMDLDGLKSTIESLKSNIQGESEIAKSLKTHLDNLESKTALVLNNAKNCINLAYTMPVGISSDHMKFELSVDTLSYTRDQDKGAVALDAHAYWTLPFTACDDPITLGFRGENIVLMGNGESKIKIDPPAQFVNAEYIPYTLSKDKVYLDLKKTSYVEIDCNGFKEMYLQGRVRFTSQALYAADAKVGGDSSLCADFEIYVSDLNDFLFEAGFNKPFKIKATEDVIYTTEQLVADFSTKRNAENFQFPKGYKSPFGPGDDAYWTGFAIKTLKVDLTQQFPEFPVNDVAAYNMLIDETGVSGWFQTTIDNTKSNKKKNSTIEAKFTDISIGLSGGKVSGGGLAGEVKIKPLTTKNGDTLTLGIDGKIYSDTLGHLLIDLKTEIKRDMTFELPIIKTTNLTLGQGTYFKYQHVADTTNKTETKYKNIFTLVVNGGLDVDNKLVKIDGLRFEGLKLCSENPHFDAGKFSLNGVDMPSLHGLPFGLKSLGASSRGNKAILEPKIYLSLIGKDSPDDQKQGASVEAEFGLVSTIKDDGDKPGWKISGLELKSIAVNIDYSAFHLSGSVNGYKDDNIYGDGFKGSIDLSMKIPKIKAGLQAYFGRTHYDITSGKQMEKEFKYWYVSGYCDMPPGILLFPPTVYLKSVSISLYSKVKTEFDPWAFKVTKVTPDVTNKFGFTAGIGFYCAQDNMIDAKVQMGMEFSASGGVSRLFLDGLVGILGKDDSGSQFNKSFMRGKVGINYDFEHEIFDLGVGAVTGPGIEHIIKGEAELKLHTEPGSWYCNIGKASDPVKLTFMKKINATTYLMFGDSVPTTLPPLDPRISALFNVTQSTATSSDHSDMFKAGTGFAFGVALTLDCHLNKFVYADLVFLGGTDLLIVRGAQDYCSDGSKYRAKGQVYVYLAAGAGIKFRKKKFEIVEFAAAADLKGEVPKPVYIEGNIAFQYRILGGLLKGHAHAKYSHGTPCSAGRLDNGVTYDGSEFEIYEDQKATDSSGREINEGDWDE